MTQQRSYKHPTRAGGQYALGLLAAGVIAGMSIFTVAAGDVVSALISVPSLTASPPVPSVPAAPSPAPTISAPPAPAGYAFHGHRIGAPIVFCVDDANAPRADMGTRPIMIQAVEFWQTAAKKALPITIGGECPGGGADPSDGVSVVAWEPLAGSVVGQARFGGGQIDEADIVLDYTWTSASGECLLAVAVHELGHVLGLDHQDDVDSIMKPVTDCRPSPSLRDIDAVRYLYH